MCSYKCTEIIITALIIAININIISSVATWRATKVNLSLFSFILLWWMPIWCLKLEQSPCDYEKRSRAWYSSRNVDTVFIGWFTFNKPLRYDVHAPPHPLAQSTQLPSSPLLIEDASPLAIKHQCQWRPALLCPKLTCPGPSLPGTCSNHRTPRSLSKLRAELLTSHPEV